ncbi:Ribosomal protein S18 acetylase RimI [Mariniphaga anaerophila]|uniref:Ribosomal protein S18 acetylase RimI n=1 Tax=Mariniphaga anaerophila TaxID=1484053 RepID=A0A1M4Y5J8_9BACT|nr:GNAT family N-acetyltransferase [Mariniphaga anaerophila]SHF01097.1 Ribosomal protein S18 acetylase RimI [Mariniphaga anaerophila]
MKIKSLANIEFDTFFEAFSRAFADYEVQLNKQQLQAMLKRRGFDPGLSFAAFNTNNRIVAFTFNGIGTFNGVPTAYDTGTGTLKEHRGKGLATKIFEYSIPFLKEKEIKQYLLEVLQHNTKAVSVYKNLGFEITREFNFFIQSNTEIRTDLKSEAFPCSIAEISVEKLASIPDFGDFYPSWQNSREAITRVPGEFLILGAFAENRILGYCVFEPVSGDVTQLAVDPKYRRKGVAGLLLREVVKLNKCNKIKVLNTNVSCNSITSFLAEKNINIQGKQFEMIKKI